ncbi:UL16-binding protein 1-like isoform X1 [Talpa occidentalis]|uniref:UL16-binding protein 1-like isoform X1 n=1 Tax=Talpa occidentalis TaxID=50954 RepID=UPI0023F6A45C|nr:UL16-binding protein 1-like isoform X1 [Talpa occidentalis]
MARPGSCAWGLLGLQLGLLAAAAPLPLRRDSLSVNITITPKTQPWCEAEVQVYGERCFSYDCQSHAVTAVCVQGMKVEAALREDLRGNLKDLAEKFNEKLLDIEPEDSRGSGPLSLQASMVIQEEASGRSRGSWQLVISGRISLRLDLVTGHWTAERPGDRWMLETWKEDRDMNATLWRMSRGDWRTWLQEVAAHWETPGTTAPLSTTLGRSATTSVMQGPWFVFGIILACTIPPGIIGVIIWKTYCREHRKVWPSLATSPSPAPCPDSLELQSCSNLGHLLRGADTEEATVSNFLACGLETSCRGGGGRGIERGREEPRD